MELHSTRRFYVKIDNIRIKVLDGTIAFDVSTTKELLDNIFHYFSFTQSDKIDIQLWSKPSYGGIRLDNLEVIPAMYEFIWVRAVPRLTNTIT